MRKRKIVPILAASALTVGMVLASNAGNAWGYFTTNTNASGGYSLSLAEEVTTVDEEFNFEDWIKNVTVTNTAGSDMYVRARVFSGAQYADLLSYEGEGWGTVQEDGYFHYNAIVKAGESTLPLRVMVKGVAEGANVDSFNIAVVYETTPVQYDNNGDPYADWTLVLEGKDDSSLTEEGGNS